MSIGAYGDNNPDPQEMTVSVNWEIMPARETLGPGANLGGRHNFDTTTQGPHSLGPTSAGLSEDQPAKETDGDISSSN